MKCPTCKGTGWDSAMRQSGLPADTPSMLQPIGVFQCGTCNGRGEVMTKEDWHQAMGKRLSDDPGQREILISKLKHLRQKSIEEGGELLSSEEIEKEINLEDPGLAEMKRMEYLMSKAPCVKKHVNPPMRIEGFPDVNALADWSEKKD